MSVFVNDGGVEKEAKMIYVNDGGIDKLVAGVGSGSGMIFDHLVYGTGGGGNFDITGIPEIGDLLVLAVNSSDSLAGWENIQSPSGNRLKKCIYDGTQALTASFGMFVSHHIFIFRDVLDVGVSTSRTWVASSSDTINFPALSGAVSGSFFVYSAPRVTRFDLTTSQLNINRNKSPLLLVASGAAITLRPLADGSESGESIRYTGTSSGQAYSFEVLV